MAHPLSYAPRLLVLCTLTLLVAGVSSAQGSDATTGWRGSTADAAPGYNLFNPSQNTSIYLTDNYGRVCHTWTSSYRPGNAVYLLEDGRLLRAGKTAGPPPPIIAGGWGGLFQVLDWDSTVIWEFEYSTPLVQQHHDVEMLPNGNVLVLAWELKTEAEAIQAGRNPAQLSQGELWPEHIIEVQQSGPNAGSIVWEWHLWDHLIQDYDATKDNFGIVGNHPELVDINAMQGPNADWIHANGIDYHPGFDQIVISAHHLNEIWIIDHSTTTLEAASHTGGNSGKGGDLLYRWGNPQNYDAGTAADRQLFNQHCAEWVPPGRPGAGNITIFNNGVGRPGGPYSSIDELVLPVDANGNYSHTPGMAYAPSTPVWSYVASPPSDFYGSFLGGTRRLPNGNTIVCDGANGDFFEVTDAGEEVWRYRNPVIGNGALAVQGDLVAGGTVFRVDRYAPGYSGLAGRDLTPSAPIEQYPQMGDFNADGVVDASDMDCFESHFSGPCGVPLCDPLFANASGFYADFDGDGDVDCQDFDGFVAVWDGPPTLPPTIVGCGAGFVRGDANGDLVVNLADAVKALGFLFSMDAASCQEALDSNDDDDVNVADPVFLLSFLFSSGPAPALPANCGDANPTPAALTCDFGSCP